MLPNVLRPNATDHVPVLADQVREALAVQPGETVVDATFGAGGHSELLAADLRGSGKLIAIDRDPSVRAVLRLGAEAHRRAGALPARRVLRRARAARRQRRAGRRDPVRPRRLLDAGRPARARLLVRDRRAARHAHGPGLGALRARARERRRRARADADLPRLRRGALRAADRPRDRAPPARAAVRAHGRARRDDQVGDPGARPASARAIRPSASSRPCGSPSTTSSARSRSRCRRRSRCCGPAAGSP